jgi:hypothetical protein
VAADARSQAERVFARLEAGLRDYATKPEADRVAQPVGQPTEPG